MAIQTVQAVINGQTHTLTLNASTGKYEAQITAPSWSSYPQTGHYYPVTVNVTDTAGNTATANSSHATLGESLRLYVKEQVAPIISDVIPSNDAYITSDTLNISFNLKDNANPIGFGHSGVDPSQTVVRISYLGRSGELPIPDEDYRPGENDDDIFIATGHYDGEYFCRLACPAYEGDGKYSITITAKDFDGNTATETFTVTVDTVAPSLTLTTPASGLETNQSALTVSGTTDDATSKPIRVTIKLNGTDQGTVTVDSSTGAFSKSVTLAEGSNTIVVTTTDAAGKTTTITRTVTLCTTAPVIQSVTINPNPVNAGQTYVISVEVV